MTWPQPRVSPALYYSRTGDSMYKRFSIIVALTIAAPAVAQNTAPSPAQKPAKNPDRIVCESYEELGSRLATKKVCKTAREWEEERRQARSAAEDSQRRR